MASEYAKIRAEEVLTHLALDQTGQDYDEAVEKIAEVIDNAFEDGQNHAKEPIIMCKGCGKVPAMKYSLFCQWCD